MPNKHMTDAARATRKHHKDLVDEAMHDLNANCIRIEYIALNPKHYPDRKDRLEWFVVSGSVVIVQWYADGGFEIYAQLSMSARVDETLKELRVYANKQPKSSSEDE